MSDEDPTDAELADQFYLWYQHFLPEEMAVAEIRIAEIRASLLAAAPELERRIAAGEVNPDNLPRPGEGSNHYLVRMIPNHVCTCSTDPGHCYPHGDNKPKI